MLMTGEIVIDRAGFRRMATSRNHYVGDWLKNAMKESPRTDLEAAIFLGVTEKTFRDWKNSGWIPRYSAWALKEFLEVPIQEVPGFEGIQERLINEPVLRELAAEIEHHPDRALEALDRLGSLSEQVDLVAQWLERLVTQLAQQQAGEKQNGSTGEPA